MIIEKTDCDSMAGLDGDEVVVESVGKWGVCWGATEGWTWVLVWQGYEVVSWKSWGGFKSGRCVGCVEGNGECVICS
jgi:hypothetical protein